MSSRETQYAYTYVHVLGDSERRLKPKNRSMLAAVFPNCTSKLRLFLFFEATPLGEGTILMGVIMKGKMLPQTNESEYIAKKLD